MSAISLVEFLAARLDEDEAIARQAIAPDWEVAPEDRFRVQVVPAEDAAGRTSAIAVAVGYEGNHIARHDPARVLREVAAMRRILVRHKPVGPSRYRTVRDELNCEGCGWEGEHGDPVTENIDECPELRDLASIYEGALGWQERWRV